MSRNRNNQNFKRLCLALKLDKHDVFHIMNGQVSKSQIDGWRRAESAMKLGSGNSPATTLSRFRPMSDEQFDQFCEGLVDWMKAVDADL